MQRRTFIQSGFAGAGMALLAGRAAAQGAPPSPAAGGKAPPPCNPFAREGNWYKTALHVHTTTSDGDVDVPTRLRQYREAGFDVVAITDHWKTNDLSGHSDEHFLAINGMEVHPPTATGAPAHHFVCLDVPHPFAVQERKLPAQELIAAIHAVGGRVFYAHPNWSTHTVMEMLEVEAYDGIEIYNGSCDSQSKAYSQIHADQVFLKRGCVGLFAVDDTHRGSEVGMGWTMVRARGLNKSEIMEAIASGSYYASCGPVIEDFRVEDGVVRVRVSPVAEIRFLFDRQGGGKCFRGTKDKTLTTAQWEFGTSKNKPKWIYCEVIDEAGKHAWTNPVVL